jgi:hypothetical protein
MSFYSELTRNGVVTNRRVRREIKNREAVQRNMLTPEHHRKDYRRRMFLAYDNVEGLTFKSWTRYLSTVTKP